MSEVTDPILLQCEEKLKGYQLFLQKAQNQLESEDFIAEKLKEALLSIEEAKDYLRKEASVISLDEVRRIKEDQTMLEKRAKDNEIIRAQIKKTIDSFKQEIGKWTGIKRKMEAQQPGKVLFFPQKKQGIDPNDQQG